MPCRYIFLGDTKLSGWKRNLLIALAVIVALGGGAYYWLIVESSFPSDARFDLDISKVRALAHEGGGEKPTSVRVEHIANFHFPATAVVAGDGWATEDLPVYSYQIVYADGATGIVDTALNEAQGSGNATGFDQAAYDRMEAAMGKANFITITHEHMDHIGGLGAYPDLKSIAGNVKLNEEQIANPDRSAPVKIPAEVLASFKPVIYADYKALAPGVVLIKSPGHTPGSQMVYVQKADGTELLLLGDVAWHFRNIQTLRERARLVTQFFLKENRKQVFGELKALSDLHAAEPKISIVPGHDGTVMDALLAEGVVTQGFE